jgi:chromosome segregation ATPase
VGLAHLGAHAELGTRVRDLLETPIACQPDSDLELRKALERLYSQTGPPGPVAVPDHVAMIDAIVTRLQTQLVDIETRGKRIVELQKMCQHTQDELDRITEACKDDSEAYEQDIRQAKADETAIRAEAAAQAQKLIGCVGKVSSLKAELEGLRNERDGIVFERNLLENDQAGMQKAMQACEAQVAQLLRDQRAIVDQRDNLGIRVTLVESELTYIKDAMNRCEAEVARLEGEKSTTEGELKHCHDTCDDLQVQLNTAGQDQGQIEILQNQLATSEEQATQGESRLSQLNTRLSERETEIANYQAKLTALETERNSLRDQVTRTRGELQTVESERGQLQQAMQGCQAEVVRLSATEGELLRCRDTSDQLEDAAESDNQEIDRLRKELAMVENQLQQAMQGWQAEVARLRNEKNDTEGELSNCETALNQEIDRLRTELALAKKQVLERENEIAKLKLTNDQDHNAIDMLQKQLSTMNVQVTEGETKLSQVTALLTNERDGLEEIRKQLQSCQGQFGDTTSLETENQKLRDSLDGATTRVLELRGETDLLYRRVDDLELERVTLMDEVNELNRAPVECSRQLQEQLEIAHKGIEMLNLFKPDDDVVSQGLEGLREALRKTHEIVEGLKSKSNRFQKERNKAEKQLKECNSQLSQKRLGII